LNFFPVVTIVAGVLNVPAFIGAILYWRLIDRLADRLFGGASP
jgi:hypothetical protein